MADIKSLGILGGTFNPVHYGHLAAGECAREAFALDRIVYIPSARPPHKKLQHILDSEHRLKMVKMAVKDNPSFSVSSLELERKGLSYTVDTVDYYRKNYPGVEIYFILGVDALQIFNSWRDIDRLIEMCQFIVLSRPGYHFDRQDECYSDLPSKLWEKTNFLEIPGLLISSSDIRKRIYKGKTIKYLLPQVVEEYIEKENLYKDKEDCDD